MDDQRRAVYFDEQFPNAWIGFDEGRRMTEFLGARGFIRLGAGQLEDWLWRVISQETAGLTCLVFAMDIIPEQIFGDVDGNVLFRRFLDAGGRVVWIGDVPAWNKGKPKRVPEQVWQLGSFVSLLGIAPVFANCTMPVTLTSRGREFGLHSTWYSMRPIVVGKDWFLEYSAKSAISQIPVEVLAWTNVAVGTSVIRLPRKWDIVRSISLGLQVAGVGGQVTIGRDEGVRLYGKRCASAWHISFNQIYPNQGFFRVWDHPVRLRDLTDDRLSEVYSLATRNPAY